MAEIKLNVTPRPSTTRGYKHHLKEEGKVPAVLYGKNMPNKIVEVDIKRLEGILKSKTGRNSIIDLTVEEEKPNKFKAMIKDFQRDPVKGSLVHVDLQKITLKDKIHTTVPIHFICEAIGVKKGGILQPAAREIEVTCVPSSLPDSIDIDISNLDIGDTLIVADITPNEGCIINDESDTVIVSIVAPRMADNTEPPAAQEEPAKPETVRQETQEA